MIKQSPFNSFKTSPEIIQLAVMLYVWFPLSLRNVEGLLHERGVDIRVLSDKRALRSVLLKRRFIILLVSHATQ